MACRGVYAQFMRKDFPELAKLPCAGVYSRFTR